MRIQYRNLVLLIAAMALSACQTATPDAPSPEPVAMPSPDTCNAKSHAWLVGEPRSRIPAAPAGSTVRVVCSTCAMTMDFSEARLNIFFDEKTGIVSKLTCG